MHTERYSPDTHFNALKDIIQARMLPYNASESLPQIGYVAMERGEIIAYAALRSVEGDEIALLDSLISNPDAPGDLRHSALNAVISAITEYADKNSIKALLSWTNDSSTLSRSHTHGFERSPTAFVLRTHKA